MIAASDMTCGPCLPLALVQFIRLLWAKCTGGAARRLRTQMQCALTAIVLPLALPAVAGEQPRIILAFGDSLVQGFGLRPENGLVPRLETWLRDRGHAVRVVNAGVSGDTSAGGRARLAWSLAEKVDAAVVVLGGNDLLRGIEPAATRDNLNQILAELGKRQIPAVLVGLRAPGNYGATYQRAFNRIFSDLAQAHGIALVDDFFAPLRDAGGMPSQWLQPDGIHPNREGIRLIIDKALGPAAARLLRRLSVPGLRSGNAPAPLP